MNGLIRIILSVPSEAFTNIAETWPYAHSKTSPDIAVCTPAFLGNFVKGPNILEEELFGRLEKLVLDEVRVEGNMVDC